MAGNADGWSFARVNQWLNQRQLQALDDAFQAATVIQALEEKYFDGGKIAYYPDRSKTVYDYVKSLRDRQLLTIRFNLAQFRLGGFVLKNQPLNPETDLGQIDGFDSGRHAINSTETEVVSKLQFIDAVIGKYREPTEADLDLAILTTPSKTSTPISPEPGLPNSDAQNVARTIDPAMIEAVPDSSQPQLGLFQSNFWGFGKKRDPAYEQRVVQEIRLRRKQDNMAVRWLLILILVPLLVHVLVKNLVFEPILGNYSDKNPTKIELNREIQEHFLAEFTVFKEKLEIEELIGVIPELTTERQHELLKEKVIELWRESREEALNGLKNLMADGVALVAFAGIVYFNRNKLATIRSFSNRSFLSLRDPTKVFLFILFTDMFVGFHSAHGWEVLLLGITGHFGLPENEAAIGLFIATVPVIIDAFIKFWIFNYLTRYSPSASAIYERMNT